jgi:hypothetical protein
MARRAAMRAAAADRSEPSTPQTMDPAPMGRDRPVGGTARTGQGAVSASARHAGASVPSAEAEVVAGFAISSARSSSAAATSRSRRSRVVAPSGTGTRARRHPIRRASPAASAVVRRLGSDPSRGPTTVGSAWSSPTTQLLAAAGEAWGMSSVGVMAALSIGGALRAMGRHVHPGPRSHSGCTKGTPALHVARMDSRPHPEPGLAMSAEDPACRARSPDSGRSGGA